MLVTSSSGSNSYSGTTEKSAKRGTEMFVLAENPQERGGYSESSTPASDSTSFSAKLASMFLVPERPEVEKDKASLETDPLSQYESEFLELADKTFAEWIRDQYLKDHGLSEEDVDAMSPEEREALETEIANAILEAMGVNEQTQTIAITLNVPTAEQFIANSAKDETTER